MAAERPQLGRKPKHSSEVVPSSVGSSPSVIHSDQNFATAESDVPKATDPSKSSSPAASHKNKQTRRTANSTAGSHETSNRKQLHPNYLAKGELITDDMFRQWTPELLNIPPPSSRPVRTTRNPNPQYVDAAIVCPNNEIRS